MAPPRWWLHISALALALSLVLPGAVPAAACVGDCDGKGRVDLHDLILGVSIALGTRPVSACQAFANIQGAVDVAQLVQGVHNALGGCAGVRFVDNGDGTITDHETGLTWEKKVALGAGMDFTNLHAADNKYVLAGQCPLGQWCQPSAAAAAACLEGAQPHHVLCSTECRKVFDLPTDCDTGRLPGIEGPTASIWEWLAQLNATRFAGHSDWRIPNVQELTTIVDYVVFDPAVDRIFDGRNCGPECTDLNSATCSCTQSCRTTSYPTYWTASNNTPIPDDEHWYVNVCAGGIGYDTPSGPNWRYVRAVRGRLAIPNPRFVDNGDGTITDRYSGLMWQKNVAVEFEPSPSSQASGPDPAYRSFAWAGQCTLVPDRLCQPNAAAAEACARGVEGEPIGCTTCRAEEGACDVDPWRLGTTQTTIWDWLNRLNAAHVAGHSDWRVPTVAELESLLDYSRVGPALDPIFNEKNCGAMCTEPTLLSCSCTAFGDWSATSVPDYASLAWMVTFEEGEVYNGDKYYRADFRAVRGARP
jgi:hypothetical protein